MKQSEEKLIQQAQTGNEHAFAYLVRLYEVRVFSYVYSFLQNTQDTEEAVQDTFVKAWQGLPRFRGESSFATWLLRIARNTALDALRQRRESCLSLYAENGDGTYEPFSLADETPAHNPPAALEQQERLETVRRAMGLLSAEHREILILREMEGYDYAAIAELLHLEVGTVKSRLFRAREALKNILQSWNFSL